MKSLFLILAILFTFWGCISCSSGQPFSEGSGKEVVLKLEPKQGNPQNSAGDFVRLKDGRILFVYSHFSGGAGDNAGAFLAGRYSEDGGETWTEEDDTILLNEGEMNVMSVSFSCPVAGSSSRPLYMTRGPWGK